MATPVVETYRSFAIKKLGDGAYYACKDPEGDEPVSDGYPSLRAIKAQIDVEMDMQG